MNLVLAFVFFAAALVGVGISSPTLTVKSITPCLVTDANPYGEKVGGICKDGPSGAARAGLRAGDVITKVNGNAVSDWSALGTELEAFGEGGDGTVTITRDDVVLTIPVQYQSLTLDRYDDAGEPTGETYKRAFLGIMTVWEREHLGAGTVPRVIWSMTQLSAKSMLAFPQKVYELGKTLLSDGERDPNGPVSVVGATRLSGEIASSEWSNWDKVFSLLMLAGSLNFFLFLFNLLPFLPLDGGHVAGAVWEVCRNAVNRVRGRGNRGPVDMARLLPLTYAISTVLIAVGALVIWADIVKPISLG